MGLVNEHDKRIAIEFATILTELLDRRDQDQPRPIAEPLGKIVTIVDLAEAINVVDAEGAADLGIELITVNNEQHRRLL